MITEDDQKEWCKKVSAKLGFDLQPSEVVESSSMRTVCKLSNNSAWGSVYDLFDLIFSKIDKEIFPITRNVQSN